MQKISDWQEAWQRIPLETSPEARRQIESFYAELFEANRRFNLTRLDELSDFLTHHLLDTAWAMSLLGNWQPASYWDLGSGCGIPGMLVALLTGWPTTLCESRRKKADFLSQVGQPHGIRVLHARAESLPPKQADLVTARAMGKPLESLRVAWKLLAPGGRYLVQTAEPPLEEADYARFLSRKGAQVLARGSCELAGKNRFAAVIAKPG